VVDRTCPDGSICDAGHCAAPAGAPACGSEGDCDDTHTCQLFVVAGVARGFCAAPVGSNVTGPCRTASECASGLCVRGGRAPQCLVLCDVADGREGCSGGGRHCRAIDPDVLEGVPLASITSCMK
jgi:hypothetical protein